MGKVLNLAVPPGYELVPVVLGPGTRRDRSTPRRWQGVTGVEAGLLAAWLVSLNDPGVVLHTDVVCGIVPVDDVGGEGAFGPGYGARYLSYRIDAIVWARGCWWVVEVKAGASHEALGQVLTYHFWVEITGVGLGGCRPLVVTDVCHEGCRDVFRVYGVEVFESGRSVVG
jgi:hypothetical protein